MTAEVTQGGREPNTGRLLTGWSWRQHQHEVFPLCGFAQGREEYKFILCVLLAWMNSKKKKQLQTLKLITTDDGYSCKHIRQGQC